MSQRNFDPITSYSAAKRVYFNHLMTQHGDSRQLRFDFGVHDIVADAIGRALAQWRDANRITRSKLADAAQQVRAARRRRLQRQKVRVFLGELDVHALIFDGRRTYQRDGRMHWRLIPRKGTGWVEYPLTGFREADLGDPVIERLVLRVRERIKRVLYYAWNGDPKWRLTYHKLPSFTLSPDSISGHWDDDLDVETIAQVITEDALRKAKWTARQARRKATETGGPH